MNRLVHDNRKSNRETTAQELEKLIGRHLLSLASEWAARLHATQGTPYTSQSLEQLKEMTQQSLEAGLTALQTGDRTSLGDLGRRLARIHRLAGFTLDDIGIGYRRLRDMLLELIAEQPWGAAIHNAALKICLDWTEEIVFEVVKAYQQLLWQAAQTRAAQLEGLNHLAAALSDSLDLDTVLQAAMQVVRDLTRAEMCRLHLPDDPGQTLHLKSSLDSTPELDARFSALPIQDSFAGRAFSSGQLVLVDKQKLLHPENGQEPRRTEHQAVLQTSPQAFACVPLLSKGQSRGVMTLVFAEEHHFDQEEQALLMAIGQEVGVAVENAQLYEQERRLRRIAETLDEVARVVNSSLELSQVLERVLAELEKVIPYDSAAIVKAEKENVRLMAARGFVNPEAIAELGVSMTYLPLSQEAIRQRRPMLVPDVPQTPNMPEHARADSEFVRCIIIVPLIGYEEVIGLLYVNSWQPHCYSTQDADVVFRFAQQAAVAIANAGLHGELEEIVRQRTQEIRRQRDHTAAILRSVADGVVVTDLNGEIVSANPVAEAWFYHTAGEQRVENPSLIAFVGRLATQAWDKMPDLVEFPAWDQQLDAPCWQLTHCTLGSCPAHGKQEISCWRTSGAYCLATQEWFLGHPAIPPVPACPVRQKLRLVSLQAQVAELREGDAVHGAVIVLRDVSRQHALDRLKSQFVSTVSHELRTPLTNVRLYHDLLKRGREDKRQHYMEIMEREIARLERLTQDILDLSRLEMQDRPPRREIVDLNLLLREQVESQAPQAASKGIALHLQVMPGALRVHADRNQLLQVFTNLLINAVNYTPEGGEIWLFSASWHLDGLVWREVGTVPRPGPAIPHPPDGDWAVVSVRDSGVGIAPEDLVRVFDRFYRGEQAERETPGSGLGLAIVREILDLHAGHILVESTPGKGSTFTVLLPLPEPEREPFVLVADDEEHVGRLICRFLAREGIRTRWVSDGQQAVEAIAQERPDLLILDLDMPVLDGYGVLEQLQAQGDTPSLPVLILSSWAEDKFQRAKHLGATDFLTKPFSGAVLLDVTRRLIAVTTLTMSHSPGLGDENTGKNPPIPKSRPNQPPSSQM